MTFYHPVNIMKYGGGSIGAEGKMGNHSPLQILFYSQNSQLLAEDKEKHDNNPEHKSKSEDNASVKEKWNKMTEF